MKTKQVPHGAFLLWKWGDRELEDLKLLRNQLLEIVSMGFSVVLAVISDSRYELTDKKVLRATAQVSQWAKARSVAFWLHTDPRQASRAFITRTGERMQNLIFVKNPRNKPTQRNLNIVKVSGNRFTLTYKIPQKVTSPLLQEVSLLFEPVGLERAFLFQKEGNAIIKDTVQDITSICHFHANVLKGSVEITGTLNIPPNEEWWVMGFPKFNTNAYDFAGRESNDLMGRFVEDMFDACTHLSGTSWGQGGCGYIVEPGRLPVSLSLYNSYLAEYGYDVRDVLYALVLNVDEGTHIHTRFDYYNLLMDAVFGAQKDFNRTVHAFFSDVDSGLHHGCKTKTALTDDLVRGCIDPWQNLEATSVAFTDTECPWNPGKNFEEILSQLVITKSLGVYSSAQRAFLSFPYEKLTKKELNHSLSLLAMFGIEWLAGSSTERTHQRIERMRRHEWEDLKEANDKLDGIKKITAPCFPEANTAIIYPVETLMTASLGDAEHIIQSTHRLIARLILAGVHCDVLSPAILQEGRLKKQGFQIRGQLYTSLIYPFPEILRPRVLELISILQKRGYPALMGGCKPRFTNKGKRIPHVFNMCFDPEMKDVSTLMEKGVSRLFSAPDTAVATLMKKGKDTLFLLCSRKLGGTVEGELVYKDERIALGKCSGLTIFRRRKAGAYEQIL